MWDPAHTGVTNMQHASPTRVRAAGGENAPMRIGHALPGPLGVAGPPKANVPSAIGSAGNPPPRQVSPFAS
jgi:hypothetical protein